MVISNIQEFPAIPTRQGMTVEEIPIKELKNSGTGLISYGIKIGDIVEFPSSMEDVYIKARQVRKGSDSKEYLLAVYKNDKPAWFSVANLRRWDASMKAVHPVAEALRNMEDDTERIKHMLGKKITATKDVTYQEAIFVDGMRTDETKPRTVACIIFAD